MKCPTCGNELCGTGVVVDLKTNTVIVGEEGIQLSPTQCEVLYVLAESKIPVSLSTLQEKVYGMNEDGDRHSSLKSQISTLRGIMTQLGYGIVYSEKRGYYLEKGNYKKINDPWPEEDVKILRENYSAGRRRLKRLLPHRTWSSIYSKAVQLKVVASGEVGHRKGVKRRGLAKI